MDINMRGMVVIFLSTMLFKSLEQLVSSDFVMSLSLLKSLRLQQHSCKQNIWKFKNIAVSFLHSLTSGLWALTCFYKNPKMSKDLIYTYDTLSITLVAFSVGYFWHDMIHLLTYRRNRSSIEYMGHHLVVILCFSIAVFSQTYVGYAVVALLVEINSIFLHMRQLMTLVGLSKSSLPYRLNSLLNVGTFIIFRILLMGWMTRWIVINRTRIPLVFYSIGSIGLAIMCVMNIVLFMRVIRSDYLQKNKDKESMCKVE